jgi:hypothetical protein
LKVRSAKKEKKYKTDCNSFPFLSPADAENLKIPVSGYNSQELLAAFQKAESDYSQRVVDEGSHPAVPLPPTHPSSLHQRVMFSSKTALRASQAGQIILAATKNIYK